MDGVLPLAVYGAVREVATLGWPFCLLRRTRCELKNTEAEQGKKEEFVASGIYDIITVGGGLGGAALARAMAAHGARVLMLEREKETIQGPRARRVHGVVGSRRSASVGD